MNKLDKEDLKSIVDMLREVLELPLKAWVETEARQRADNVLGRILGDDTSDLRHRVETQIRLVVAEAITKHLDVRVGWK